MAYRLCTFDSFGKIIAVSPSSYDDDSIVVPSVASFNPGLFSFVDESLIGAKYLIDSGDESLNYTDAELLLRSGSSGDYPYDPRTEVTLFLPNTYPNFAHGDRIVQDLTKADPYYNAGIPTTIPSHSSTQKKFGPSSCKFTSPTFGYTGGGIVISNISKNTYSLFGATAPHNDIGRDSVASYSFEMFFYPSSLANNFTLLQKGPTGASANWKLGYDSSAGFLQFAWQSYGTTGGYNYSENIVATAGITTNTWHHVAVSLIKNGAGTCYQMAGYFNGSVAFSRGVTASTFPEMRYNNPMYLGNNSRGSEPFSGYVDSVRVLESGNTSGLFGPSGYGFLPFGGGTLGVPTLTGFEKNDQVAFILNFNAYDGVTCFYAESRDYIAGTITRITNLEPGPSGAVLSGSSEVGVRNVVRHVLGSTGATGYSDPTGFTTSYGAVTKPFITTSTSITFTHGLDYPYKLNGVFDNNPSLDVFKVNYRNSALYDSTVEMMLTIEGCCGNKGSCGNPYQPRFGTNPFGRLFSGASGNCYGTSLQHNSLYINPLDTTTIKYIMDNGYLVTQGICAASYSFTDAKGITRYLTAQNISNLRLDILQYQNKLRDDYLTLKTTIKNAVDRNGIKVATISKSGQPPLDLGDLIPDIPV